MQLKQEPQSFTKINSNPYYSFRASINQSTLSIELYTHNPSKLYHLVLENNTLPKYLAQSFFSQISTIYESLKYPFQVNFQTNEDSNDVKSLEINISIQYKHKNKSYKNQTKLILTHQPLTELNLLKKKITNLQSDLTTLKQKKQTPNNNIIKLQNQTYNRHHYPSQNTKTNINMNGETIQLQHRQNNQCQQQQYVFGNYADLMVKEAKEEFQKVCGLFGDVSCASVASIGVIRGQIVRFEQLIEDDQNTLEHIIKEHCRKERLQIQSQYEKVMPFAIQLSVQQMQQEIPYKKIKEERQHQKRPPAIVQSTSKRILQQMQKKGQQKFILQRNILTYIQKPVLKKYKKGQSIIRYKLKVNKHNSFKVRIIRATQNYMYVGIVQLQQSRNQFTNNALFYCADGGQVWQGKPIKDEGSGFHSNDIVQVKIKKGEICWYVNDFLQARHKTEKLNNQKATFLPIVEMVYEGDQVQFVV